MLVFAEIALTLALTVAAGLLLRSFATLSGLDAGFRSDHVLLVDVALKFDSFRPAAWAGYFESGAEALRSLPGVEAAGAAAPLPLSGQPGLLRFGLVIDGRPAPAGQAGDRVYLR